MRQVIGGGVRGAAAWRRSAAFALCGAFAWGVGAAPARGDIVIEAKRPESAVAAAPEAPGRRGLGGVWRLDEKRSEALRDKLPQGGMGGPRGGMGGGPGGMGGGPRGGGPPGGMGGGRMGGMRGGPPPDDGGGERPNGGPMRELSQPPLVMLIEDVDSLFIVSERGETRQVLVLGDLALAASTYPDAPHVAAKWSGKRLVAEAPTRRGGTLKSEYRLAADGRELIVKLTLDQPEGMPGISLERVYVRDEGDE